jgi:alkanesulfonate monooxygenase SsuD/methylene tetrahydromethanopterin reductase-like flavin-dependent oxidoreductase (luciferase family)
MKFLAITLIVHAPDPVTGVRKSTTDRFREVIGNALLAEELGFDGFGVGERHERPFISSSPPVVLSHIAALTSRIRLFTAAGTAGYYSARSSQQALAVYRPIFEAQRAFQRKLGLPQVFADFDDYLARSSALIGSPQQVIDKVHRYHGQLGHSVMHLHADAGGLTDTQHRESLELFQSDIAPVLRRDIADPPWPGEGSDDWTAGSAAAATLAGAAVTAAPASTATE